MHKLTFSSRSETFV